MKRLRIVSVLLLLVCLSYHAPGLNAAAPGGAKAPLGMADILAWRSINVSQLSDDGKWLAYRVSPVEGDSEVVVRQTGGDREYRFGCGEGTTGGGDLAFSADSRWLAFSVAPTKKEAARLKKQRKPLLKQGAATAAPAEKGKK